MDPSLYHAFYELEDRHWWFVGRRAIVTALLGDRLGGPTRDTRGTNGDGVDHERRILDVGCGTGGMLPVLSRYGRVTGVDTEPLALEYCRKRGFTDVHLEAGFEAGARYDVVTLFDVLEHVADESGFLRTVAGHLEPGGVLMATVPAFQFLWSRHDDLNRHQRRYTKRGLVEALERAGLEVERSSYFNTLLFPAAAAVRLLSPRGRRSSGEGEEALRQLRIGGSNRVLAGIFGSERHLLRRLGLPFGASLYAIARKK